MSVINSVLLPGPKCWSPVHFRSISVPPFCQHESISRSRTVRTSFYSVGKSRSRWNIFPIDCASGKASTPPATSSDGMQQQQGESESRRWRHSDAGERLNFVKEQAMGWMSVSRDACLSYSRRASVVLDGTSVQMGILADRAAHDLTLIAKELSEDGREYWSAAAAAEPVRELLEAFTPSSPARISRVHDFHLGIPYGVLLSVGGFLNFMFTGSISAVRFGVILGGALLLLSVSSLRSWKNHHGCDLALRGQAVIAGTLFVRELRQLHSQEPSLLTYPALFISGAVAAFYAYQLMLAHQSMNE